MPVRNCDKKKFRIGSGKCIYDSKTKAQRAYRGYLGSKYSKSIGGIMETKMSFYAPISKFDEEQRMVYGVATCSKLDNQNEIVDYEATKDALKEYSQWRNIREMHKPSAVGVAPILELRDSTEELYIGAKVVDDQAWAKCKEGVYKGFSIGGEVLDRKIEMDKISSKPINRVIKYLLNEISLVDRPANSACKFQTMKRDTSIHTITVTEDPLKAESARVMEKSLLLAKRSLSKAELENLPDSAFGRVKIVIDGDTIVKQRDYPIPDRTHAINMIRKMNGDDITEVEKENIHKIALGVLGKKHVEAECSYCVTKKLQGGVEVNKEIKKGSVTITHDPQKKTTTVDDGNPADEQNVAPAEDTLKEKPAKEKVPAIDQQAPADTQKEGTLEEGEAGAAPVQEVPAKGAPAKVAPAQGVSSVEEKLDRVIALLEGALGEEELEEEQPEQDVGYEEDADEEPAAADIAVPKAEVEVEEEEEITPKIKVDECVKSTVVPTTVKLNKGGKLLLNKRAKSVMETLIKENKEYKDKLSKLEKQPLPRKDATKDGKVTKIEKYQDVKLEKKESTFSEELQIDILKAQELRMAKGTNMNKDEDAFCKRVAERMLDEKLSK